MTLPNLRPKPQSTGQEKQSKEEEKEEDHHKYFSYSEVIDRSSFIILVYQFCSLKASALLRTSWCHQLAIHRAVLYILIKNMNEEKFSWVPKE